MTQAQHIDRLCGRYRIRHYPLLSDPYFSRFAVARITRDNKWIDKKIWTPPVENLQAYTAALHEVGHIATRIVCPPIRTTTKQTLDAERAAWQWALKQAREPLDKDFISDCALTYINHAAQGVARGHPIQELL